MNSDRKLFENSFWFTSFLPFSKLPFLLSNCCDKLFFLFFCSCSFFRFRFRLISFCFLVFESSLKFFVCLFTYFAGLVLLLSSSSASSFYNFICFFFFVCIDHFESIIYLYVLSVLICYFDCIKRIQASHFHSILIL